MNVNDSSQGAGKIDLGRYNDFAYFDGVNVIGGGSVEGGFVNGGMSDTEDGGAFNPFFAGLVLLLMGVRRIRS